jgi:uncharacterized protein (TIGR03382 family)
MTKVILTSAATMFVAAAANAAFVPGDWTFFQANGGNPGSTAPPATMSISAPGAFGNGFGSVSSSVMSITGNNVTGAGIYAGFRTTATSSYLVSVDWARSAVDTGNWDGAGYFINGTFNLLVTNANGGSAGNWSFNVNSGDVFGFAVWSADGSFGAMTVELTNYVPAPGAAALLGLAGLVGGRRRRA